MIIGQTLASTSTVYSLWFDRLGDSVTFYLDVIAAYSEMMLHSVIVCRAGQGQQSRCCSGSAGG